MFPEILHPYLLGEKIEEIVDYHRSGDQVYQISGKYILKVSEDVSRLEQEYKKDKWANGLIPSPKPILFVCEDEKGYYLRECLAGAPLCVDAYLKQPLVLVDLLAEALKGLHATKVTEEIYIVDKGYHTLIHGDFCLPNILADGDRLVGYIDLGDAGVGDPWRDYAWCIWSLEYNTGSKAYTPLLLKKLGIAFDEDKYRKYTG